MCAHHAPQVLNFKFYFLGENGSATTMFRRRGQLDGETLQLDDTVIPVILIVETVVREKRIAITVLTGDEEQPVVSFLLEPSSKSVTQALKSALDVARSHHWAQRQRERLEEKGLGHTFRAVGCPICQATNDLTDLPETPQLYCRFCDSLTTINGGVVKSESEYRLCEECGLFSKPLKFTIFYFYFLLVVFGTWSQTTWRCRGCMRKDAWLMFFGNLPFLLGVPAAITQLVRCYGGGLIDGTYSGLDTGNLHARRGRLKSALASYGAILQRTPFAAGVKYNLGRTLIEQNDLSHAATTLEMALEDCSNYSPAYLLLCQLYEQTDQTEKRRELRRIWGEEEDADEKEITAAAATDELGTTSVS